MLSKGVQESGLMFARNRLNGSRRDDEMQSTLRSVNANVIANTQARWSELPTWFKLSKTAAHTASTNIQSFPDMIQNVWVSNPLFALPHSDERSLLPKKDAWSFDQDEADLILWSSPRGQ